MKIVNLEKFREHPEGTVFAKYEPCYFGELCIKGGNAGDLDFFYRTLWEVSAKSSDDLCDVLFAAQKSGEDVEIDCDDFMRDGMYDDGQLFAVFTKEDCAKIINAFSTDTKTSL